MHKLANVLKKGLMCHEMPGIICEQTFQVYIRVTQFHDLTQNEINAFGHA